MTKGILIGVLITMVATGAGIFYQKYNFPGTGGSFYSTETCSISTSTSAQVGPSGRKQLIATTSRRAWLTITSTTTPISLGLNDVKGRELHGLIIVNENGTVATSTYTFDSQQMYTGALRGFANATTTVSLVECSY